MYAGIIFGMLSWLPPVSTLIMIQPFIDLVTLVLVEAWCLGTLQGTGGVGGLAHWLPRAHPQRPRRTGRQ